MIVIPCCGKSSRFKSYIKYPKQLLMLNTGSYIIEDLVLKSKSVDPNVVIVIHEDDYKYYKFLSNVCSILQIPSDFETRGSADTTRIACNYCKGIDEPLIVLDADGRYSDSLFIQLHTIIRSKNCCVVDKSLDDPSLYSFVVMKDDKIVKTIEKEVGGDFGIIGMYGFHSRDAFVEGVSEILNIIPRDKECTTALIYNSRSVKSSADSGILLASDYDILGTPLQYSRYRGVFVGECFR